MAWFISDFQNKWIFKSLELDILSSKVLASSDLTWAQNSKPN